MSENPFHFRSTPSTQASAEKEERKVEEEGWEEEAEEENDVEKEFGDVEEKKEDRMDNIPSSLWRRAFQILASNMMVRKLFIPLMGLRRRRKE